MIVPFQIEWNMTNGPCGDDEFQNYFSPNYIWFGSKTKGIWSP